MQDIPKILVEVIAGAAFAIGIGLLFVALGYPTPGLLLTGSLGYIVPSLLVRYEV